jgi:pyrimidine operon attenuation protein / uracil phosphoribosyltransferase
MTQPAPLPSAESLLAHLIDQIRESLKQRPRELSIVGIHTGGAWVAKRVHEALGLSAPISFLSSAFHRDDYGRSLSSQGASRALGSNLKATDMQCEVQGASILLVDDILYTGRTVRAALNELFDFGRPDSVELAVLIDRGGRQLPVAATFCGGNLQPPEGQSFVLSRDTQGRLQLATEQLA